MLQSCTKFRIFNLLLAISVVNVVVYRTFFMGGFRGSWWGSATYAPAAYVSVTSSNDTSLALVRNAPPLVPVAADGKANATVAGKANATVAGKANATAATVAGKANATADKGGVEDEVLPPVGGPAKPLEAFGKLVQARANVTAPWAVDNTTTLCPLVPPKLVGPLATYSEAPSFEEIVKLNPGMEPGGHFHPPDCRARSRVAIIVPYRDREQHLRIMLHNLHPILQRQQLDYVIIVVELAQPTKFNRAMLLNIGAVEALGLWDFQCFVFHDVDLVPENDRNLYSCPEMPRHMSAAVDKFKYRLPYTGLFGGVTALSREHFYKINGYANKYFGWGGEDDDLSYRVFLLLHPQAEFRQNGVSGGGLKVTRYSMDIARYRMIKHERDSKNDPNPKRFEMLKFWKKRQPTDGLNTLQYDVQKVEFRPGYTWILVNIDMEKVMKVCFVALYWVLGGGEGGGAVSAKSCDLTVPFVQRVSKIM
nr:hypothetical protein BaRGS_029494 [Batillaria attramentaria]